MPEATFPIERYFHTGDGYNPFLVRPGWQVAQLNFTAILSLDRLEKVERHQHTDEVFVLMRGRSVLIAAAEESGRLRFTTQPMEPFVTYNIPTGCWHWIVMEPGDLVLIVEKDRTHLGDVEYRPLQPAELADLRSALANTGGSR